MNIAFIAFSSKAGAGVSVFQNLLPAIAKVDVDNNYFVFISDDQKEIAKYIPERFISVKVKYIPSRPFLRVLLEQLIMPFYLLRYKINLLYSVGNTTILFAPCKVLLFIENTNPFSKVIKNWSISEKIRNKLLFFLTYLSALKAHRIRFCSLRSREIICKILHINKSKTFVLYHGLNENWVQNINSNSPFPFNYILFVSVVAPHKNFEVLMKAFSVLKKRHKYNGKLVIVGDTCYKKYFYKLKSYEKTLELNEEIIFAGKIPNNNLIDYYQNCDLFIFPSIEETFGIPLIEALSLGCPVLASDGDKYRELFIPFNELGKDKVIYFDPYSYNDLVSKILYVLQNRDSIINKLVGVKNEIRKEFCINKIASIIVEEFNKLLSE